MAYNAIITGFLSQGTAASRPAAPNEATTTLSFYYATDTLTLSYYDWNAAAWATVTGTGLLSTEYTSTTPSAPSTGTQLFSRKRASFTMLAERGIIGSDAELQQFLGSQEVTWIVPVPGSSTPSAFGCAVTTTGATARTQTTTSQYTAYRRLGLSNSSGTNAFSQCRVTTQSMFRGNATNVAGFYLSLRFGVETTIANGRIIAGLQLTWAGNVDPSTTTDCLFFGKDSADSNLQVMHNDSSGTCTKVDLGASFPANTSASDMYEGRFYCPANSGTIYYWIKNLISGTEADSSLTTNLPTTTTAMYLGTWFATGSTSGIHAGAMCSMFTQTLMP